VSSGQCSETNETTRCARISTRCLENSRGVFRPCFLHAYHGSSSLIGVIIGVRPCFLHAYRGSSSHRDRSAPRFSPSCGRSSNLGARCQEGGERSTDCRSPAALFAGAKADSELRNQRIHETAMSRGYTLAPLEKHPGLHPSTLTRIVKGIDEEGRATRSRVQSLSCLRCKKQGLTLR